MLPSGSYFLPENDFIIFYPRDIQVIALAHGCSAAVPEKPITFPLRGNPTVPLFQVPLPPPERGIPRHTVYEGREASLHSPLTPEEVFRWREPTEGATGLSLDPVST